MKEVLLKGVEVSKSVKQSGEIIKILDSVSIDIFRGDFTIVMGPSGAGKSTLLYALSAMDTISEGKVEYEGQEISRFSEKKLAELRAKAFGFIFQQTHLVSNLTLFENVAVAGYANGEKTEKEVQETASHLLSQMNVENARNRLPYQASGGEAQRAAIARAMINHPSLIFADEPTGALNRGNTEEVLNILSSLNKSGQSILMVTHDIRAAIRASRVLYLEDGKILDELTLSTYCKEDGKAREEKVNGWLQALRW